MEYVPYVLLGIMLLFLAMQLVFRLGARRLEGKPAPEVSDLLERPVDPTHKSLFYFYSDHCPPCRTMSPRIDRLAERYPNIFKVNVGKARELATRFGITATPAVIVTDASKIEKAMIGIQSERRLAAFLETKRAGTGVAG
jgi:thioredoxin 1